MGWIFKTAYDRLPNGKIDRKTACDKVIDYESNDTKQKVLLSFMVDATYYAAVEQTNKKSCEREVFAAIFLTSTDKTLGCNFGYKAIDEHCNPTECDCPAPILELLTPTDNERANCWRSRCQEKINSKNRKMTNTLLKLLKNHESQLQKSLNESLRSFLEQSGGEFQLLNCVPLLLNYDSSISNAEDSINSIYIEADSKNLITSTISGKRIKFTHLPTSVQLAVYERYLETESMIY